jgi:hypothetical protein
VIITSNNEKELPDAFLRRCVFHFIDFPEPGAHAPHRRVHHPGLERARGSGAQVFYEIRNMMRLRKRPSTSELIDWIAVLKRSGVADVKLDKNLPFLGTLLKKEQDIVAFADQLAGRAPVPLLLEQAIERPLRAHRRREGAPRSSTTRRRCARCSKTACVSRTSVTTAATSGSAPAAPRPSGTRGKVAQRGIRVGGKGGGRSAIQVAQRRAWQGYRDDLTLDVRQMEVALRKLRAFVREGADDELDLEGTIDATAKNAGELDVVLRPPRRPTYA